eukprot:scaffold94401_cov33-Tisochrysis_lutea.AAC.4
MSASLACGPVATRGLAHLINRKKHEFFHLSINRYRREVLRQAQVEREEDVGLDSPAVFIESGVGDAAGRA